MFLLLFHQTLLLSLCNRAHSLSLSLSLALSLTLYRMGIALQDIWTRRYKTFWYVWLIVPLSGVAALSPGIIRLIKTNITGKWHNMRMFLSVWCLYCWCICMCKHQWTSFFVWVKRERLRRIEQQEFDTQLAWSSSDCPSQKWAQVYFFECWCS